MTKHTHFVLTCTKNHVWHEPIPDKKPAVGEHRLCPTCGGSSWIALDAPRTTLPEAHKGLRVTKPIGLSQDFVTKVTNDPTVDDVSVIGPVPSPASIAQTKVIPVPADLIPTRVLLNETETDEDTWQDEGGNNNALS